MFNHPHRTHDASRQLRYHGWLGTTARQGWQWTPACQGQGWHLRLCRFEPQHALYAFGLRSPLRPAASNPLAYSCVDDAQPVGKHNRETSRDPLADQRDHFREIGSHRELQSLPAALPTSGAYHKRLVETRCHPRSTCRRRPAHGCGRLASSFTFMPPRAWRGCGGSPKRLKKVTNLLWLAVCFPPWHLMLPVISAQELTSKTLVRPGGRNIVVPETILPNEAISCTPSHQCPLVSKMFVVMGHGLNCWPPGARVEIFCREESKCKHQDNHVNRRRDESCEE